MLRAEEKSAEKDGLKVSLRLEGMAAMIVDTQEQVYSGAPLMMGVSMIVVVMTFTSVFFCSALIGVRLLVTIALSMLWVFGVVVTLLQDLRILGSQGDGIHWLLPLILVPVGSTSRLTISKISTTFVKL